MILYINRILAFLFPEDERESILSKFSENIEFMSYEIFLTPLANDNIFQTQLI